MNQGQSLGFTRPVQPSGYQVQFVYLLHECRHRREADHEHAPARPARGHRRLPEHERHADRGRRRRGARPARAAPRERVREGRHRRRGRRPRPPPGRRPRRRLHGPPPRRHRRRPHRRARQPPRRGRGAPRRGPAAGATRELEREYRAIVEEILELRGDDGRIARVRPLDHRARHARRHRGLLARPDLRAEGRAARDGRRRRAARARASAPARAARRAAGAQAHPRRRGVRRAEAAARVHPAPPDGLDPQGARRGRRARSSTSTARRSPRPGMPEAVREQAERELAGSSAWASRAPSRR